MHFLILETLSFKLMYVNACYPVGTTISKTSSLFTALLQHYYDKCCSIYKQTRVSGFPLPTFVEIHIPVTRSKYHY